MASTGPTPTRFRRSLQIGCLPDDGDCHVPGGEQRLRDITVADRHAPGLAGWRPLGQRLHVSGGHFRSDVSLMTEIATFLVVNSASGTSPSLTVTLQDSPDGVHWANAYTFPAVTSDRMSP